MRTQNRISSHKVCLSEKSNPGFFLSFGRNRCLVPRMRAVVDGFDDLVKEISDHHVRAQEEIIREILVRHYGSIPLEPAEVFAMLERDGLCLEKRIPPHPQPAEYVLYRGPATRIGEKLDETCVIDRVEVPSVFEADFSFPTPTGYQ